MNWSNLLEEELDRLVKTRLVNLDLSKQLADQRQKTDYNWKTYLINKFNAIS